MRRRGVFGMTGSSFTYAFIQQFLLFAILIVALFAAPMIMFPDMSGSLAAAFAKSDTSSLYLTIEMVLSLADEFMIMFLIMVAAVIFVSPVAGGASVYLNDRAFKEKDCNLGESMTFMGRNYGRLLGTYALQVIITIGLFLGFMIFMYYFHHNMPESFTADAEKPVMYGWMAGILLLVGAVQFSPYCSVYGKKSGGPAIADSFRTVFRGGFGINLGLMIVGGLIWLAIVTLPSYIVLLSMCPEGVKVSDLLFALDVPGHDPLLWIVMILSFIVATIFMFDFSQAVFFNAKRRMVLKYR